MYFTAAKEKEKAQKAMNKQVQGIKLDASSTSRAGSRNASRTTSPIPAQTGTTHVRGKKSGPTMSLHKATVDQQASDIAALNLDTQDDVEEAEEPPLKVTLAREKVIEAAKNAMDESAKKAVSLVVIGMCGMAMLSKEYTKHRINSLTAS